ncbi:hypothetical protein K1719_016511 [Acacia pycnantha]|nr:hypothetical protein K1719_016511 [Acacia pycnantha]
MRREKGLWHCWCLVMWPYVLLMAGAVSSELYNKTCTSQCGNITNISYPFRLPHDPPHCGHPKYELACENNVTLLHLHLYNYSDGTYRVAGTYRVLGKNYHNFRIKLVDRGIQSGNCSSLPLYSLSLYHFTYFDSPYDYEELTHITPNDTWTGSLLFKQVAYLICSDPARDDTTYVDTAPCVKGGGHLYAVAGDLLAPRFQPQCRLEFVTLVASDWESLVPHGIKSYADIHTLLSFGFELSWWARACDDYKCSDYSVCVFSPENRIMLCIRRGLDDGIANNRLSYEYNNYPGQSMLLIGLGCLTGTFVLPYITDLKTMTENFKNKLGEGGFATVYKGKLRSGPNVAIKMLGKSNKANSGQDFMSEVATIGRIHHFNVVHLVGFCVEGTKCALIYEFMSHGSLDKHIFSKEENMSLTYHKIYEISLGVARGIAYLHHGCEMQILHFDIKPHNILLDENFTPKISDFGLARLYAIDGNISTLTKKRNNGIYSS